MKVFKAHVCRLDFGVPNMYSKQSLTMIGTIIMHLGTYDEKTHSRWVLDDPKIGIGIRHVFGIIYAFKTFYDARKGRRVFSVVGMDWRIR